MSDRYSGTDSSAVLEYVMYLFIYKGFHGGSDRRQRSEALVIRALNAMGCETGKKYDGMSRDILRTEKGKPYFKEIPVAFSVSHTDDLWVCLMSEAENHVGADIQKVKEIRRERIMDRYFTDDEKEYVRTGDENAFFKIWTRKEAYAKYTGQGLSGELRNISTLDDGEAVFIDFDIRAGIKGSCCVREKGDLCLRMI